MSDVLCSSGPMLEIHRPVMIRLSLGRAGDGITKLALIQSDDFKLPYEPFF